MKWNYRIIEHRDKRTLKKFFTIHEVYYEPDNKLFSYTAQPAAPFGETLEELEDDYRMLAKAFKAPILKESEFNNLS